jgi:arginyl-tRNA synthetase
MKSLQNGITASVQKLFSVKTDVVLTRPDPEFGDFATNVALQLAKEVGKNPREIAEALSEELRSTLGNQISEVTIAGPGFINLRLSDTVLVEGLQHVTDIPQVMAGKEVVAEYSDPNPFKELHAGHLYTTLVGDAIARLIEEAGAKVHRINYGGDVGLHVGRAMWAIIQFLGGEKPEKLAKIPEAERPSWLSARYVEGSSAYEEDESAKADIVATNKRVYEIHATNDHDSDFAKIYWECREWSYIGFDKLYEQLQVKPFERTLPESEATPAGIKMVEKGLKEGVFEKSDGAVVFRGEDHGLHTRVFMNSAGLPTYEAKDLGLAATKWQDYHFDQNFIITGNDIVEYMKVVLKALSHFYPEVAQRTNHLTHGMIKLPGGVKMSSRKGNVLRAADILEAADKAAAAVADTVNHRTVLAAVKYAFLKSRIGGDIIYDPEESVATEGNSGPYLQYAHARARSILRKSVAQATAPKKLDVAERTLAVKLTEFSYVVEKTVLELSPHLVCTYLYELAQAFNRFYEQNRVVGDKREAERLYLVGQYAAVLKTGLELLGIHAPEQM